MVSFTLTITGSKINPSLGGRRSADVDPETTLLDSTSLKSPSSQKSLLLLPPTVERLS